METLLAQMPQRILIVEDDAALAGLMATVLTEAGYYSEVAATPDAAHGTFDLVVSDYLAPTFVPGQPWPFLEQLRGLTRGGPILGCTGHQDALADAPASLGISAVAAKPFDVDELVRIIEQLLEQGTRLAESSPVKDATLPA